MKFIVACFMGIGLVSTANAQCANGVCAVPQRVSPAPVTTYVQPAPVYRPQVTYGAAPQVYYTSPVYGSSCASGSCSAPVRSYYSAPQYYYSPPTPRYYYPRRGIFFRRR